MVREAYSDLTGQTRRLIYTSVWGGVGAGLPAGLPHM